MYLAVYGAFRREQCPGTKEEGGDVSLVHERLDVRIDGVTCFERRERTAVIRRQVRLYHHCHHRQLRRGPCRVL